MLKYLIPRIAWADLPPMFGMAFLGAIVAGMYGVLHDQITFSIGPEYFTNLKFQQFYADFLVDTSVCFMYWSSYPLGGVGFVIAWFLSRRLIPKQPRGLAYRGIFTGFAIVFGGIIAGLGGYFYGIWRGPVDYSGWWHTSLPNYLLGHLCVWHTFMQKSLH